jgi:hypothetical protein
LSSSSSIHPSSVLSLAALFDLSRCSVALSHLLVPSPAPHNSALDAVASDNRALASQGTLEVSPCRRIGTRGGGGLEEERRLMTSIGIVSDVRIRVLSLRHVGLITPLQDCIIGVGARRCCLPSMCCEPQQQHRQGTATLDAN